MFNNADDRETVYAWFTFSHWLVYANSAANPIIYNFLSGKLIGMFPIIGAESNTQPKSNLRESLTCVGAGRLKLLVQILAAQIGPKQDEVRICSPPSTLHSLSTPSCLPLTFPCPQAPKPYGMFAMAITTDMFSATHMGQRN